MAFADALNQHSPHLPRMLPPLPLLCPCQYLKSETRLRVMRLVTEWPDTELHSSLRLSRFVPHHSHPLSVYTQYYQLVWTCLYIYRLLFLHVALLSLFFEFALVSGSLSMIFGECSYFYFMIFFQFCDFKILKTEEKEWVRSVMLMNLASEVRQN